MLLLCCLTRNSLALCCWQTCVDIGLMLLYLCLLLCCVVLLIDLCCYLLSVVLVLCSVVLCSDVLLVVLLSPQCYVTPVLRCVAFYSAFTVLVFRKCCSCFFFPYFVSLAQKYNRHCNVDNSDVNWQSQRGWVLTFQSVPVRPVCGIKTNYRVVYFDTAPVSRITAVCF